MGNKFQDGFIQSLTVRGVPLGQAYPGKVWWVNGSTVIPRGGIAGVDAATASAREGKGTYKRPFATIDFAIGKTVANRGDVIAIMPGYSETLSAANAIALDVAGIALVGLGTGTLRPQISFDETDATFALSAADTAVIGFDFISNKSDCVTLLTVAAAALGSSFESCNFTEAGTNLNYKAAVTLTTLAHDQSFINCTFITKDILMASFITGVVHDRLYIEGCRFFQHGAQNSLTALVVGSDVTSGVIRDCSFRSNIDAAKFIGFSGTSTGVTWGCSFSSLDVAGAIGGTDVPFKTTGFHCHFCLVAGEQDTWGIQGGGTALAA